MLIALSMVGSTFVLQHTPLDITSTPPSSVTLPITFAETDVIDVTSFVITVAISGSGLHDTSIKLTSITIKQIFFITKCIYVFIATDIIINSFISKKIQ